MSALIPSYIAKLGRAEKHLVELKEAIDAYAASHPYTVSKGVEGKKQKTVYRLVFTADPANTDIPIIAADVIYNMRSGLDHLMSCLVANKERNSAIFPVFFQGVWENPVPGENAERAKLRARWTSDTKSLGAPALAILKRLQPPDDAEDGTEPDRLQLLNSLSNRDRHEKLPIVASGLTNFKLTVKGADGKTYDGLAEPDKASDFAHNEARLLVPEDAVDVQIEGAPLVAARVGQEKGGARRDRYVTLPSFLGEEVAFLRQRAVTPLMAYVKR